MPPGFEGWQRLHPASPLLRAVGIWLAVIVFGFQYLDFITGQPLVYAMGALLALICAAIYGYAAWRFVKYRIEPEHFELQEGVLFRTRKRVPFARLESVDIARPFVAQVLGLSEVRIEVAGASDSEVRLKYLSAPAALSLRDDLLHQKSAVVQRSETESSNSVGNENRYEVPDLSPITSVPTKELLLGYWLAPAIVPVIVVFVANIAVAAFSFEVGATMFVVSLVALPVYAIGLLIGLESNWNFELSRAGNDFVIRRGLLNQLTQKVPLHRVQAVRVESPLFWRPFARSKLIVDIAGYGGGGVGNAVTSVLLPIGNLEVIQRVTSSVMTNLEINDIAFLPAPHKARYRSLFWKTYGVHWSPEYAITRTGVFRRRIDIVPHKKVQSIRVSEGPWQRVLGLSTLHVDSVGTNIRSAALHRTTTEIHELANASRTADSQH